MSTVHAPIYLTGAFVIRPIYICRIPKHPNRHQAADPGFGYVTFPLFLLFANWTNGQTGMPSQDKMEPASFLGLPVELHGQVIDNLSFPDNISLKATCRYFSDLIIFEHAEQIKAEASLYAISRTSTPVTLARAYVFHTSLQITC